MLTNAYRKWAFAPFRPMCLNGLYGRCWSSVANESNLSRDETTAPAHALSYQLLFVVISLIFSFLTRFHSRLMASLRVTTCGRQKRWLHGKTPMASASGTARALIVIMPTIMPTREKLCRSAKSIKCLWNPSVRNSLINGVRAKYAPASSCHLL